MSNKDQDICQYITYCIEIYKEAKKLKGIDVIAQFTKYNILDHIKKHYGVLHTMSDQYVIDDINNIIQKEIKK